MNIYRRTNGSDMTLIWKMNILQQKHWIKQQITLSESPEYYDLVLEGVAGQVLKHLSVAIDDLQVENDRTCESASRTTTTTTTTTRVSNTTEIARALTCNFEADMCSWEASVVGPARWDRYSARNVIYNTAPMTDVTTQSSSGHYAMVRVAQINSSAQASLASPTFSLEQDPCLSFWYQMSGSSTPKLVVSLLYRKDTTQKIVNMKLWSRQMSKADSWSHAYVHIPMQGEVRLQFEASISRSVNSYVAIDDVQVLLTKCPASMYCDFEADDCDYENDVNTEIKWKRAQAINIGPWNGPRSDHTYGTNQGTYMLLSSEFDHITSEFLITNYYDFSSIFSFSCNNVI